MADTAGAMCGATKMPLGAGYKMGLAADLVAIEAIRPVWEQMRLNESYPAPNADIDRYLAVIRAMGAVVVPHVMLVYQNGDPKALVIGRVQKVRIGHKIGYEFLCLPQLKCLSIVYGGILGNPTREVCGLLMRELMDVLRRGKVDLISFNHIRTDSHIFDLARTMPGVLCGDHFPCVEAHWQTRLARTVDGFRAMLTGKQRRHLARDIRRLQEKSDGPVRVTCYQRASELDLMIDVVSNISSATYQQALNRGFSDNVLTRSVLKQSAESGWLRVYVLYAGPVPVAFEIGMICGRVYFAEQAGYDYRWRSYGPGTILSLKILEELSADNTVDLYDYGFGDAEYKQRYGHICWCESSIYIFAPRIYPIFVNMTRSLISAGSMLANYFVANIGMKKQVKQYWRVLLRRKAKNANAREM